MLSLNQDLCSGLSGGLVPFVLLVLKSRPVPLVPLFKARQHVTVEHELVWEAGQLVSGLNLET